jgi:Putative Actinobacterial Holin-X, holin superfamily III
VTEVSDRVSNLVREEIELAKAEVTIKARSLLRGTVAVLAGAVFGVFAVFMGLEALAWALNAVLVPGAGSIWEGFLIVFGLLAVMAIGAFGFAWTKLKAGSPPAPTMAIDEAKRIRETVASKTEIGS